MRAGTIYGRTDKHAAEVEDSPVTPADLIATILDALGVPPETNVATLRNANHRLSHGRVLRALFS
jgi:arylsulfatase A-like enzyme